jgi:flavocytochrome c
MNHHDIEMTNADSDPGSLVRDPHSDSRAIGARWDETVDVVVIGSGFAGLAAAIEAKNGGASVVILEKMKGYGGNSVISDGLVAAAGTPLQKKKGIEDSHELMYKDLLKAGLGLNFPDLARRLAESSNEVVQWTIHYLGVKYQDKLLQLGGHSVPRSYVAHNNSGATIVKQQLKKVKELGLKVRTQMYLHRILRDAQARVFGVVIRDGYTYGASDSGAPRFIKARKAVVLATGGFANDIPFRTTQDPRLTEDVDSTNKLSTTAEALREALRIGATPVQLSWIQLGPWTSPDEKMYGVGPGFADYAVFSYGVMVDTKTGRRFVNELADRKTRADAILKIGQPCIGIADTRGVERSGYNIERCLKKGVVRKFDLLKELALYYNIPDSPLKETIEKFNDSVEKKREDEWGRPVLPLVEPMIHPPYYGIRLWPKVHYTMGGIQINDRAQVMDLNHQPIKGLYAAGELTGGVHGACRLGSCAITDCLIFGRIAGKNAATEK